MAAATCRSSSRRTWSATASANLPLRAPSVATPAAVRSAQPRFGGDSGSPGPRQEREDFPPQGASRPPALEGPPDRRSGGNLAQRQHADRQEGGENRRLSGSERGEQLSAAGGR